MELLLEKKKSEYMQSVARGSATCEENTEIIVSDKSPDIARIVRGIGTVFLKDKEVRNGKIAAEGTVKGAVLYVAEGEKNVRKLDVTMPFFCTAAVDGLSPESRVSVRAHLRSFDVREVNPRKVAIRASVEITYRAYERGESDICGGAQDSEKYGICERKHMISDFRPIEVCEKSFSVSDDIEFSGDDTDMSEILFGDARLSLSETKIIGNKSILKGAADVKYVYTLSDGSIHSAERELPFSQIIDIEGMDEEHELDVEIAVTGVGFDTQYDASGEARYMTVSITAIAYASVYEKTEVEVLADAYSTMYDYEVEKRSIRVSKFVEKFEKRVPVSESIETGSGVKRVVDASVAILPPVRRREETGEVISSDAVVSVMYISEGDEVLCATRKIPVICPMELSEGHSFDTSARVRGCTHSLGHNDEINVRFLVDFSVLETEDGSASVVSVMNIDTENADDARRAGGITIKRVNETCDVWSLAREHRTTASEIAAANGISEEGYVPKGKLLLIPRHR